ncbi:hypothetical protein [Streptomyces sp. NPDC057623]|uniref:hypothetical protein n=1 Tax=Streptomyces sp. NPDC057623 TaxID=3346187 RepID=UPI0036905046
MSTNENAVALRFTDRAAARQAFDDLTRLGSAAEVRGAVLIERLEDGAVCVPAVLETDPGRNAGVGGLVGSLMGILGGPLGMAVGWGIGAMIGDGHDHRPSLEATGAVAAFTSDLPLGGTVVLVEVGESDPEALNLLAMTYDAVLERGPADVIRAELKEMEQVAELVGEQQARERGSRRERGITEVAEMAGRRGGPTESGGTLPRQQLAA